MQPTWADFWVTNAGLIVVGVSCAAVGWRAPRFALLLPAQCLINTVLFHIVPSFIQQRPNPGLPTAMLLYIPLSIWSYVAAHDDGVLSVSAVIWSTLLGAGVMAFAIAILKLGTRIGYPDAAPVADTRRA